MHTCVCGQEGGEVDGQFQQGDQGRAPSEDGEAGREAARGHRERASQGAQTTNAKSGVSLPPSRTSSEAMWLEQSAQGREN